MFGRAAAGAAGMDGSGRLAAVSQPDPQTAPQPPGRPGRYQRSFGGLVGAMVVTVAFVIAFVVFRSVFRDDVEVRPDPVDVAAAVEGARRTGLDPVHPRELPEGWTATSVDITPDPEPVWALGMLTDDERFVGLRQQDTSASSLLADYVDADPREVGEVRVPGSVAPTWTAYDDEGGDHAFVAEVDTSGGEEQTVIVYGSAPAEELEALLADLTQGPPRR